MTVAVHTLWIKFQDSGFDPFPVAYDEKYKKRYNTFEEFKQNFIRGWCGSGDEDTPVGWLAQNEQPASDAKFNSEYPEFRL